MSLETVMVLARSLALAVNITTMFLCMRPGRGTGLTLSALVGCAVLVLTLTRVAGLDGFVLNFNGLLFLPVVLWLFHGQAFQKVFAFFMQYQFSALMISLADAVCGLTIGYDNPHTPAVMLALVIILMALYLTAVLRFGRQLFERLFIDGRRAEWIVYSLGAVFAFAIALGVRYANIGAWLNLGLVLFILWGFGVLCFAIVNTHDKTKHKAEADFAASVISSASGYYQQISELNNQINVLQHDMKYNLTVFGKLLAEDNREELTRYLAEVTESLAGTEPRSFCSNSVVNVLLVSFAERCEKQNIHFETAVYLPSELQIPNYELCIVLGNLLENAVEACGKMDSGKRIELVIKQLGKQLVIKVANRYNAKDLLAVEMAENALPVSMKKNGGLGLRSVRAVAEKYNGELIPDRDGEMFTAYVSLGL